MNNKKRLLVFVILGIIILSLLSYYFVTVNRPAKHTAIRLNLKQLSENSLQLQNLVKEKIYPARSNKNPYLDKYYQVSVLGQDSKSLFVTKTAKQKTTMFFSYPGAERSPSTTTIEDIVLYLPYYQNGEKIVISDEQENILLSINLPNALQ